MFWEAAFGGVRHLVGAQVDLLPPLMVYAGLCTGIDHCDAACAVRRALVRFPLSQSAGGDRPAAVRRRLGDSPETRLILRDQTFAQLVLGLGASAAAPALNLAAAADNGPLAVARLGHAVAIGRDERGRRHRDADLL